MGLAEQLRDQGFATELDLSRSAFGKQLKRADRSGAPACLILGEAEAAAKTVQLKWLASGEQETLTQTQLLTAAQQWRQKLLAIKNNSSSSLP